MDAATHTAAADLVEATRPLDVQTRAMFGGYCFYLDGLVVGLVCDGHVFLKRSAHDDALEGWATLAPAYPGARPTWRLPHDALATDPDAVRDHVREVARHLSASGRRARPRRSAAS